MRQLLDTARPPLYNSINDVNFNFTITGINIARLPRLYPTERSHEENQERAYIAASRRQDRSLEARVQSARMASDIHKARTGKSLRITEEIVRKEEMYEEEDDDLPRSYRLLNKQVETDSPEFNARIEAWLNTRGNVHQYIKRANDEWNDHHINRAFAQSFPQASEQARRLSRQLSIPGQGYNERLSPQQAPQPMHPSPSPVPMSPMFQQPGGRHDSSASVPALSPPHIDRPASVNNANTHSPNSTHDWSSPTTPVNAGFFGQEPQSTFTTELPPEGMPMTDVEMVAPYEQSQFNQNWPISYTEGFVPSTMPTLSQGGPRHLDKCHKFDPQEEFFGDATWHQPMQPMDEEPAWDSFLNVNAWAVES
ncbi:hypothetical protein ACRE_086480 [Hapsidospora chrysogenum ATCC 11550]|uniref:Uncharacterized protein n=1 Tax=Hapsidospora chrysogenum (strain ATCC 11550 / CBS 779.69 / DSM 880 / IAM 14645 / JCM 23072 / IMI 49137) TaxID=857340 RepID=A0A086SU81_HAPC1|nr:hypothetical protein ACRE_086480 [Hapsidospora chrysogenum ATCC 11550]